MTTSDLGIDVDVIEVPIDVDHYLHALEDDTQGALSIFQGRVRNHDLEVPGQRVTAIEYRAHPHAARVLREELASFISEGLRIVAIHRVGLVPVGEVALLVAVSGPHRQPGMTLVPAIVEKIKETLPVWKRQILEDGSSQWSNLP